MSTIHVVPLPGTALSAVGLVLREDRLYKITPEVAATQRDDFGRSWVSDLSDDAQCARWGRRMLWVVEIERARPGATLVRMVARTDAPFQGSGYLPAGQTLTMPAELAARLHWLRPEEQRATHGYVQIDVEPIEGIAP
ncbi:hypothetical protein SAMN03159343_2074 [Klenkia marina]|uniref:Uncharacterized protein n=1 Tax=Klenkia marina TaxID=1960309 RepID=A0A1G4Y6A6_9ACTN|nr:hypothetical protein [Klenkia marina]SCX48955.1 hypothetical protein SAMN03159343_2074 [Klenkia marina]